MVSDNLLYAKTVKLIRSRASLNEDSLAGLEELLMDSAKAQQVIDLSKSSMGMDISEIDLINIMSFADRVVSLSEYRLNLHEYLKARMGSVAPNLSVLVGEQVRERKRESER